MSTPVRATPWEYIGGDVITPGGASVQVTTLPDRATIVELRPNGDDLYFQINGTVASTNSPSFVANGGGEIIGPMAGLTRIDVFMATGTVHITFWKEHGAAL
jgi:hypothetical protein